MTKSKAYYQAYLIIQCLTKEEYSLIPQKYIDEINQNMEKDDSIKVDPNIPLEKQKIDEKTYDILDKVIRSIEKAYGKDAIDNPNKYADQQKVNELKEKEEKSKPSEKVRRVEVLPPKEKNENSNFIDSKRVKDLENENIKLKGIIDALEEENKKIEKAKEIFEEYKTLISSKDDTIEKLKAENKALLQNNEELYKEIDKLPGLVKKIFIKKDLKMLYSGENLQETGTSIKL